MAGSSFGCGRAAVPPRIEGLLLELEDDSSAQRCTCLPCGCVGIEIVSEPLSGIAVGMLENMEKLKSREHDGVFYQYLRFKNGSSKHRFLRLCKYW